jgi:hypothetical protein
MGAIAVKVKGWKIRRELQRRVGQWKTTAA